MTPIPDPRAVMRAGLRIAQGVDGVATASEVGDTDSGSPPSNTALAAKMADLLDTALHQGSVASRAALFDAIVDQLLPDEARIIAGLSDGATSAMVNVYAVGVTGRRGELLLENAALVGKTVNVSLPAMTPTYVTRLRGLGLLEVGHEDPRLKEDYQILLADSQVLKAIRRGGRGPLPARTERFTLTLSSLGQDLWAASNPAG